MDIYNTMYQITVHFRFEFLLHSCTVEEHQNNDVDKVLSS